jgi:cell division protein FtsQ
MSISEFFGKLGNSQGENAKNSQNAPNTPNTQITPITPNAPPLPHDFPPDFAPQQNFHKEKKSKARRLSRRKGVFSYVVLISIFAVLFVYTLLHTFLCNIKEIKVKGNTVYTGSEIVAISGVRLKDNLNRLDFDRIKTSILANLVEIENIEFETTLSGNLTIKVTECEPTVAVETGGEFLIISQGGKIFQKVQGPPKNVLLVKGFEPDSTKLGAKLTSDNADKQQTYTDLTSLIAEKKLAKIRSVNISDVYNIDLDYDGRISVKMGNFSSLSYKLDYAQTVITTQLTEDSEGFLILRGSNIASFISKSDMENFQMSNE